MANSKRKWTIAIRPAPGQELRKVTKVIGLNGEGFSVLAPYHKARSGTLLKLLVDPQTWGRRSVPLASMTTFTAEDRAKLSYHTDGFAQFSGENTGKIISGRDPTTGEPKGLGLLARTLDSPSTSGPSVGIQVWGIEEFEVPRADEHLVIFEPEDHYYRSSDLNEANAWHVGIYAFSDKNTPPLQFEGEQPMMLYQPHPSTAGIPGAVIKLKMIHLTSDKLYLGLYVDRYVVNFPAKSGWTLSGPGSYTQYQSGHSLMAVYPRDAMPVMNVPSLDRTPSPPSAGPTHPATKSQPQ